MMHLVSIPRPATCRLLSALLALLGSACFGAVGPSWFPEDIVLVFVANQPGNLVIDVTFPRDPNEHLVLKNTLPIHGALDGTLPIRVRVLDLPFTTPSPKGFLLVPRLNKDHTAYEITRSVQGVGIGVDLATALQADPQHQKTAEILGAALMNEKDERQFFNHAFFATRGFAHLYADYIVAHQAQEQAPARRLMLAELALSAVGTRALPAFQGDLAQMSELPDHYQGALERPVIEGLAYRNALLMRDLVASSNFETLWALLRAQKGETKVIFLRSLCDSVTSRRPQPASLFAPHREEMLDWALHGPDKLAKEATKTVNIIDAVIARAGMKK